MAVPYNFDFSNMQTDQGQQAAPNTPSMGFEAATAALDTNELLHLILAEVPRQYRTRLRGVSKNWKSAVEKIGHAFDPLRPIEDRGSHTMMPKYGINVFGKRLVCNKTNPAIACYTEDAFFDCPGCGADEEYCNTCDEVESIRARVCFDQYNISKQEGEERELEFITDPPITLVTVSVGMSRNWWSSKSDQQTSVLRVPGGIRVRDLKDCFAKMRPCDYPYSRVASFAVLGQMQHEFCEPFPNAPEQNEVPDPLDDYRRPRFGSEIGESQDESGGGDTPYASEDCEVYDVSQGEEGSFSPKQYDQSPPGAEVQGYEAADSSQGEGGSFSPQQYDQSPPDAEVQGYEAATAALDTNELLHLIVDEVPREYRTQLRRVSRAWKAVVEKLGHVIDPLEDDEYDGFYPSPAKFFYTSPAKSVYRLPRKRLVCNESNPLIRCRKEDTDFDWMEYSCLCEGYWGMRVDITFDREGISGMSQSFKWEDEFITDPPITQVHFVQDSMYEPVTLCVRGGIRVRDLKESFRNMEDNWSGRVVSFQVLHQHSNNPAEVCWWYVDNYKGLRFDREVAESQEQTGGGDTPYASEAGDSQDDDGEFREGGLENDEAKSGYQAYQ
jgi:hypothetical protein